MRLRRVAAGRVPPFKSAGYGQAVRNSVDFDNDSAKKRLGVFRRDADQFVGKVPGPQDGRIDETSISRAGHVEVEPGGHHGPVVVMAVAGRVDFIADGHREVVGGDRMGQTTGGRDTVLDGLEESSFGFLMQGALNLCRPAGLGFPGVQVGDLRGGQYRLRREDAANLDPIPLDLEAGQVRGDAALYRIPTQVDGGLLVARR